MTSSHPDTSLRDRKCIKPAFYAVYWHYPLPAADTHAKKISEKLWVCQDGFSETVFWCMSLSMLHYAPEDSTKQASEPLRYRSRTCFEQAEIIYSACGAAREHQHHKCHDSTASEIPQDITSATNPAQHYLHFCGDLQHLWSPHNTPELITRQQFR